MEDQITTLWAQVLDSPKSDITSDTNFFEYGGDSVAAIRFVSLAHKSGISIDVQSLFTHPLLSDLATFCSSQRSNPKKNSVPAPAPIKKSLMDSWKFVNDCIYQCNVDESVLEDIIQCTPYQKQLIAASHECGAMIQLFVFELESGSEARARSTFEVLRRKTPLFRTRIIQHDMELYQVILNDDLLWNEERMSLQTYKTRESNRRIRYGDPLSRYAIIRDAGKTYFVWIMSHAVFDRWSKGLLFSDLRECFQDPDKFSKKPDRPPFANFVTYVASQQKEEAVAFWLNHLKGLPRYDMLFKPSMTRDLLTKIDDPIMRIIEYKRTRKTTITLSTVAHVAWALTLANRAAFDDIFYMSVRSGRQLALPEVDEIIGPVFGVVPVRIRLKTDKSLEELLRSVQDFILSATPYEPFAAQALQEHFGHRRMRQSVFLYEPPIDSFGTSTTVEEKSGAQSRLRIATDLDSHLRLLGGLVLYLTPKVDELTILAMYDEHFMEVGRVNSILDEFEMMLKHLMTKPWKDTTVGEICPNLTEPSIPGAVPVEEAAKSDLEGLQGHLENGDPANEATLTGLFSSIAKDAPAIIIPEGFQRPITYAKLYQDVRTLQRDLAVLGISQGSVVSSALPNSYELIVSFLATSWQRSIIAPLNPGYKQEEFEFYIGDMDVNLIIIPKGSFDKGGAVAAAAKGRGIAIAEYHRDGETMVFDLKESGRLASQKRSEVVLAEQDDIALILHTSGTTGKPKAVPLTHRNLMSSIDNICRTYQLTEKDRTVLIMPLFHIHGLLASFLAPLRFGSTIILPPRLDPSFWNLFTKHQATWYTATPTMHRIILQFPPPDPLPPIKFIRSCSSQLPPSLFHRLEERFKAPVLESYAMTEASHLMTSNPLPPAKRLAGCVGRAADGVEVAILTPSGDDVPQDQEGEVCIRGENVTKGYLRNPTANETSFTPTGFFRTGDQGKLDEDGYLTLTGRIKELINKGGEKISPVELDNVIAQHPAVAEVVCFALDDDMYGQDVACAVRLEEGEAPLKAVALKKWVGERVAAHKVPRKIWFVDEIPKTPTGKVQRKMVAEVVSGTANE